MPIFISYSSKDQKSAEAICTAIENRGFPCWISSRDIGPGENFQSQIVRAIRNARIMVLVFSSNANNSEEIKKELVLAGQSSLVVIPVRVEDVAPDDAFAYEFATRQWIDVFGDWEHAIGRVIRQIESVVRGDDEKPAAASVEKAEEKKPEEPPPVAPVAPVAPIAAKGKTPVAAIVGAAAAIILIVAGVLAWQFWLKAGPPPAKVAATAPGAPAPTTSPQAVIAIPPARNGVANAPAETGVANAPAQSGAANPPAQSGVPSPGPASSSEPAPAPAAQPAPVTQPAPQPETQTPTVAAGQTFRDCPNCPEMVVVPAGSFQMGAAPGENQRYQVPATESGRDEPPHQVTFAKPFALGKVDVTYGQFAAFAHTVGFEPRPGCLTVVGNNWVPSPRASWEDPGYPQVDNDPAVCMNLLEVTAYLRWLGNMTGKEYRLPSEAEWEYAERAGTTTAFYWGDDPKGACAYENVGDESHARKYGITTPIPCNDGFPDIAPVGSFKPNPFGLYDMAGNIFVLTADCWNENYDGAPTDGSAWKTGQCGRHVVRKAAYGNPHAWMFRSANRDADGDMVKRNRFGFRVALSLP
ncbi:MAG TPA: SUMF1/EgtB/PvdO family nonheme iron enzyme [Stellaceae bacterium]|nr:SUMF1/EgtB/PvdO family nonheme iron enzyme [Stellaceae bacterium]